MDPFDFVKDGYMRDMLQNAFKAIQISEGWEFVKRDPGDRGFMFSQDPMNNNILGNMDKCQPSVGHSGASYGCIMREMQFLANQGIESYKARFE